MRCFDAATLLFNITYDARRMLDEGRSTKEVVSYIEKKINFLRRPPPGNKIRW